MTRSAVYLAGLAILGVAVSITDASQVVAAAAKMEWVRPVGGTVSYGFFDPRYHKGDQPADKRQHLGADLVGSAGQAVMSPVTGTVVTENTSVGDIMRAYLVIRESSTGYEHVLGHITAAVKKGQSVKQGQTVGYIRDWGRNSHVHWGVNSTSVGAATGMSNEGEWGWGRAPFAGTAAQATSRGWVNPFSGGATILLSPRVVSNPPANPPASSPGTRTSAPAVPKKLLPGKSSSPGTSLPGSKITMTWGSVTGAANYELRVRDMTDKRSAANETLTSPYYTLRVKSGHTYRWSIRACNASGCSASSDNLYFTAQ